MLASIILCLIEFPTLQASAIPSDFTLETFTAGICRQSSTDTILYGLSYAECISECRARSKCVSLGFIPRSRVCRLNFDGGVTPTDCGLYIYSEKSTWKKQFKVGCEDVECEIHQKCQLSSSGGVCVNSECRIPSVYNGIVFGNQIIQDKRAAFGCERGYSLIGNKQLVCTPDGWNGELPVCTVRTCADWALLGMTTSGDTPINPLGTGNITVFCDFDMEPGKGFTVLHHDQESKTSVGGFEDCFSYSVNLTYDVGLHVATRVADLSKGCKQYVRWDCHHITEKCIAWLDRHGNQSSYFTGAPPPGKYCSCGETGTCHNSNLPCNCDVNKEIWLFDDGDITDKHALPITAFLAGDTGDPIEQGFHTIGPMYCF